MKGVRKQEVTKEWFASNWLQLQYGWKPLIEDVKSAAAHLAYLMNRPVNMTYRASYKTDGKPKPNSSAWDVSGYSIRVGSVKAILSHISEVRLLGLMDPASLVWEKLPYSFVADWFIPIGDYLSARGLDSSLTGKYVLTRYDRLYVSGYSNIYQNMYSCRVDFSGGGYFYETVTVSRTISTSLPVPRPVFKPLSESLTWGHAVNAVALLVNAFPRFGTR
jgi:hypothetical protein